MTRSEGLAMTGGGGLKTTGEVANSIKPNMRDITFPAMVATSMRELYLNELMASDFQLNLPGCNRTG